MLSRASPLLYSVPKFPEPPPVAELRRVPADLVVLPSGSELWRLYFQGGYHPTTWNAFRFFGPIATARFDHHEPPPHLQQLGMLYAATEGPACVAEVFQEQRLIDRTRRQPWLVGFAARRPLRLLNLCGLWPTQAGASMALCSGPRPRARRWSSAAYAAFPDLDGLWYPSSMFANRPAAALYERAADAVPTAPFFHAPLAHPGLAVSLYHLAQHLHYSLV